MTEDARWREKENRSLIFNWRPLCADLALRRFGVFLRVLKNIRRRSYFWNMVEVSL